MQFKQYPSYKNSGVEWLGDVPEHWYIFKSNKIFKQSNVRSYESDQQLTASQKYGVIPQSLYMKKEESKVVLALSGIDNFKHVDKNDFVISLRSFQGGIELCFYDGCVSPAYTVLKPNKVINYSFWSYLFKSTIYISVLNTAVDGIREGKTISYTNFGKIYINIPPLSEQAQIANYLDTETTRIDNLIAKQEKLIELLEEQRKSIISHAVTKGLNPNAPMKDSGVEWLGDVPEHWRISSLKRYGYFKGGAGFPHAYQGNTEENIPFFKVNSLSKDKRFLSSFSDFVGEETAKKLGAKIFPKNSIFFAKVGAALLLERIRTNQQPCCIDNNMMGFVIQNELSFDFAFYLMSLIDFKYLVNPGAVPSINESQISSFLISVPPISEQTQIANYLDTETARIDNLIAKQKNLIEKLKEYRSSIISHAVTGKIDIREFGA